MKKYNQENPSPDENFRNKELMYFKFRFLRNMQAFLLTFHHAQTPQTLLAVINDFVVDTYGDMPASSISKI